jgi:hypothetical protein
VSSGIYAIPLSVGGGLVFGTEWTNLNWEDAHVNIRQDSLGGSVFFDAYFASLSMALMQGNYDIYADAKAPDGNPIIREDSVIIRSATLLDINLVGKFPVPFQNMQTLQFFPMIGIGCQISTAVEETPDDLFITNGFNNFRVLLGLGIDLDLSDLVFIRISALPYYNVPMAPRTKFAPKTDGDSTSVMGIPGGFGVNGNLSFGFKLGNVPNKQPQN